MWHAWFLALLTRTVKRARIPRLAPAPSSAVSLIASQSCCSVVELSDQKPSDLRLRPDPLRNDRDDREAAQKRHAHFGAELHWPAPAVIGE